MYTSPGLGVISSPNVMVSPRVWDFKLYFQETSIKELVNHDEIYSVPRSEQFVVVGASYCSSKNCLLCIILSCFVEKNFPLNIVYWTGQLTCWRRPISSQPHAKRKNKSCGSSIKYPSATHRLSMAAWIREPKCELREPVWIRLTMFWLKFELWADIREPWLT